MSTSPKKTPAQRAAEKQMMRSLPRAYGAPREGEEDRREMIEALKAAIRATPTPETQLYDALEQDQRAEMLVTFTAEAVEALGAALTVATRFTAGSDSPHRTTAAYLALRDMKDAIVETVKRADDLIEAYGQLAFDGIEGEGLANVRLANGRGVTPTLEPYTNVTDKKALREWIEARNPETGELERPDLVAGLALPWPSLNALVKEMWFDGEEPPPGVKLYAKPKVKLLS